jgi:hypothetical protein
MFYFQPLTSALGYCPLELPISDSGSTRQCPKLSRRDPRELARSPPLSQYQRSQRAQENPARSRRMSPANMTAFAEIDTQNLSTSAHRPDHEGQLLVDDRSKLPKRWARDSGHAGTDSRGSDSPPKGQLKRLAQKVIGCPARPPGKH